jgi:hypothetical protein
MCSADGFDREFFGIKDLRDCRAMRASAGGRVTTLLSTIYKGIYKVDYRPSRRAML